ncbi:MAG: hypothetical protein FJ264_06310 [Planctomycetes bacterium]|nr:hypothetical protein [Planctomycetota bacterium]
MATKNIHYEIPENEETILCPPIGNILELTLNNKREIQHYNFNVIDIPFQILRDETRIELLNSAFQYTQQINSLVLKGFHEIYCRNANDTEKTAVDQLFQRISDSNDIVSRLKAVKDIPIILTGHEPIFYHPGIWIKNHLAHYLAKNVEGIGVNLIVDSDACTMGFIYMPLLAKKSAVIEKVPFVKDKETLAYEEISFENTNTVEQFRNEVVALIDNNNHPNVKTIVSAMKSGFDFYFHQLWYSYTQGYKDITTLLTSARKRMETEFGINNLEIPVSMMCKTKGFYYFFLHILFHADQFVKIHNKKLNDYRSIHKIYSKANPFPDLQAQDSFVELPFWLWEKGGSRNKCYAHYSADSIIITNGNKIGFELRKDEDIQKIVSQLGSLELGSSCIKLRPRAIATTMFLRLFFSDVFIHGIGGAKYDVITNEIIKEFFNVNPPDYIATTTTLFLPIETRTIDTKNLETLQKELIDMRANPERHASEETKRNALFLKNVENKRLLIEKMKRNDKEKRKQLFDQIKTLNVLIFEQITNEFINKQNELEAGKEKVAYNEVVKFREYPICIFPLKTLKDHFANVFSENKNTDKQW